MSKVSHKRERLVDAARNLFHAKGFNCTSLADIAEDSGVPLATCITTSRPRRSWPNR